MPFRIISVVNMEALLLSIANFKNLKLFALIGSMM
jgi:hypothetical protein